MIVERRAAVVVDRFFHCGHSLYRTGRSGETAYRSGDLWVRD
jgi:hypothetical protein